MMNYDEIKKCLNENRFFSITKAMEKNESINREEGGDSYTLSISDTLIARVNGEIMEREIPFVSCFPLGVEYDYSITIDKEYLSDLVNAFVEDNGDDYYLCYLDNCCYHILSEEEIDDMECGKLKEAMVFDILRSYSYLSDDEYENAYDYLFSCEANSEKIFYEEDNLRKAISEGYERP